MKFMPRTAWLVVWKFEIRLAVKSVGGVDALCGAALDDGFSV